jgi:two-component system, OmpR family, osmolarity sensor histidine kinase EnvZ
LSVGDLVITRSRPVSARGGELEPPRLPSPMLDKLARAMGRPLAVLPFATSTGEQRFGVDLHVGADTWWASVQAPRPPFAGGLFPALLSVCLIVLGGCAALVVGMRWITRPMRVLSQQMLSRRTQLREIDEPQRLSHELRGVVRSFNEMVRAVELTAKKSRELLAGMCHDLRTPLARLRLRAETDCSPAVWERMEQDFSSVERIISQFLAYVQGQSKASSQETLALGDVVADMAEVYRLEGADVRLVSCQAPGVMVPDLSMQRALTNLIDNALRHGQAPVELEVELLEGNVWLWVFDHGKGISKSDLSKAFQPFVRFASAAVDSHSCGLGLAIVDQIAHQFGGKTVVRAFDGTRSGVAMCWPHRQAGHPHG